MKMECANRGILKRTSIISIILLMLLATMPAQNNVVTGNSTVILELSAGWNLQSMPESISASDLALKSSHITSIVRLTADGYYVSYIPSLGVTDFICEPNEGIYIHSEVDTNITFAISTLEGFINGDLFVSGNTVLDKDLTVNGSMSVQGNLEVNNLNVTDDLTISGNLTVGRNLTVGGLTVTYDITINGYLTVEKDVLVNRNLTVMKDVMIYGNLTAGNFTVANLTISEDLNINGDLTVSGDATIGGNLTVTDDITILGDFTITENLIVSGDLFIGGNITGAAGRTATLVVAASDSSSLSRAQSDYVCDGINDNVEIQAAIDTVNALGVRGTVQLLEGTYHSNTQIEGKSNVDVIGPATIIVTSDSDINAVLLDDITNATWKDITVIRVGNPSGRIHAGKIMGTTDDTLRIIHSTFDNQATPAAASAGLYMGENASPYLQSVRAYGPDIGSHGYGIAIFSGASPTMESCYGEGGSGISSFGIYVYAATGAPIMRQCEGVSTLAAGIMISEAADETELYSCKGQGKVGIQVAYDTAPTLVGCIGRGNDQIDSHGIAITDQAEPVLIGCTGYGGSSVNGHGIYIPDAATPTMHDCTGIGGNGTGAHGIYILTAAAPTIIGGRFVAGTAGSTKGMAVNHDAAPRVDGAIITKEETSHSWMYDDINNGRFRPYSGVEYSLISIHVIVYNAAVGGTTLDIGTSIGGDDIAADIPIDSTGARTFAYNHVHPVADGYLYATPSTVINDDDLVIYYAVARRNGGFVLDVQTAGTARFTNVQVYGGPSTVPLMIWGNAATNPNFFFNGCLIENYDSSSTGIFATATLDASQHFDNCHVKGTLTNIINMHDSRVDYFQDLSAEITDHIVSAEDLTQVTPITCTIANQPDVPRSVTVTVTDLDTSITDFTIYVNGIDAKGNDASEQFTFSGGLNQAGNIAFAIISSVEVSSITGDNGGDVLDVGIGSRLGLAHAILTITDVYKVKKNSGDYPSSSYTVDPTYDTVDVNTGGAIISGDDFTVYYKSH